jgi:hypothetical protein
MVDEFPEFLEIEEFILAIAVVDFLEIVPDVLAKIDEADFGEVEEEEQIELFAFLEGDYVFVEEGHDAVDVLQFAVAVML